MGSNHRCCSLSEINRVGRSNDDCFVGQERISLLYSPAPLTLVTCTRRIVPPRVTTLKLKARVCLTQVSDDARLLKSNRESRLNDSYTRCIAWSIRLNAK